MRFIEPKKPVETKWKLSDQTACIVENYAKYTGYSEEKVVDRFLKNILCDPNFANYIRSQRRNKRLISRIFFGDSAMRLLDEYAKYVPIMTDVFDVEIEDDEEKK